MRTFSRLFMFLTLFVSVIYYIFLYPYAFGFNFAFEFADNMILLHFKQHHILTLYPYNILAATIMEDGSVEYKHIFAKDIKLNIVSKMDFRQLLPKYRILATANNNNYRVDYNLLLNKKNIEIISKINTDNSNFDFLWLAYYFPNISKYSIIESQFIAYDSNINCHIKARPVAKGKLLYKPEWHMLFIKIPQNKLSEKTKLIVWVECNR